MNRPSVGPHIASSLKHRLALCGELLINLLPDGVRLLIKRPGTTELAGQVVQGHLIQNMVDGIPFINDHSGQSRRHADDHVNIQGHFDIVAPGVAAEAVQQDIGQGDIGQFRQTFILGNVGSVVTVHLEQSDRLAGAIKGDPGRISGPKIIGEVIPTRARTAQIGRRVRAFNRPLEIHRVRQNQIIQALDREEGHG